ncbi:MAG: CRISPR system precrRNA processing endoribonuclease RAMP protein Cas6 [Candidatus Poribacteria bacterium]|nr:CRISPR system precrRNA processing endoribonuclease RAMP protein Cas6 [Candidatus Poribacteria bacterium]
MLQNFRFARYRFTYTVQEPLKMPAYKGNVFRSRFGYLLRDITCIGGETQCKTRCQFPDRCVYSKCFETPVPDDSPILRGQPFAPHPFILEPPRTQKLDYTPGDTFTCTLTLIGDVINLLPWLVFTFREIGKRRVGIRGKRGQCHLNKVETLPARNSQSTRTIYTAESELLTDDGLILGLDDVMQGAPQVTNEIELEFLTPTSIKVNGRWTDNLTFEHLVRNLLRRVRFLSYFHCGEDLEVDARVLIEAADAVTDVSDFRWIRADRYSYRTEKSVPMGGFIGKVCFTGELEPFLPFIHLGEYLHIGHHTAFGHGQYRLASPTTPPFSGVSQTNRATEGHS